jgi:NDP-sugar pyrophosphorylase family protein
MSVAVLCGGKGTRIAAIAGDLPKALVLVNGTPFLDHQLRWLRRSGAVDVVLLTGYRAERIREFAGDGARYGLQIRYSDDGNEPRGTAGALARALPLLSETFVCIYGDALLQANPIEVGSTLGEGDDGVMSVYRNEDRWVPSNVRIDAGRVTAYEKKAAPGTMTHIDYGINAFRASAFSAVAAHRPVDLADVHRSMIDHGSLRAFPVEGRFYEIGSPEGLAETEDFVRTSPAFGGSTA